MTKFNFKEISFITSATSEKGYPTIKDDQGRMLPEIGVAGRSNVGKSSLLNFIFGKKDMVKTSQKPGKTRLLNFFQVDQACVFCDLPGYGFASVSQKMKESWSKMIEDYLLDRENMKLVLQLIDIRHDPTTQDIQFCEWIQYNKKNLVIVFTKADKLAKGKVKGQVGKLLKRLNAQKLPYVITSVTQKIGKKELISQIKQELENAADA